LFPFVKRTINNKLCSAAQLFLLFFYDFNAWMENQMHFHSLIGKPRTITWLSAAFILHKRKSYRPAADLGCVCFVMVLPNGQILCNDMTFIQTCCLIQTSLDEGHVIAQVVSYRQVWMKVMSLHKICPLGNTMTKHTQPRSALGVVLLPAEYGLWYLLILKSVV
jgi:hypothetical protein